ncbi:MAG: CapA family protein [Anaerolineae bacterium]|nr:CapA family protein [Anaerolineae bacterium]
MRYPRARLPGLLLAMVTIMVSGLRAESHSPTLDDIFRYREPQRYLATLPADEVVLLATGDVLLGRTIYARMVQTDDFTFPFAQVAGLLAQADITWVNLENAITATCPLRYRGLTFCGRPAALAGLLAAGVDVVNVANNHTENFGVPGAIETVQHLSAAGLAITGLSEPVIVEQDGQRIGLLAFNDASVVAHVRNADPAAVQAAIVALRPQVDVLLVGFHWGVEYTLLQNQRQRHLALLAIDAGADAVIGHHPHWLQGVELYRGRPIVYSLGNFIFDQGYRGYVTEGAIAVLRLRPPGPPRLALLPVIIADNASPRPATAAEARRILRRMASVSQVLPEGD